MRVEVLTIFPEIFSGFLSASLVGKAVVSGALQCTLTDIRDFAPAPHYHVDDTPYGGGAGMVMTPGPIMMAIEAARAAHPDTWVVSLSPAGERFSQPKAIELSRRPHLTFLCGRYEGIDQRAIELGVDEEISIGDFVVMGGEVPTMIVIEACLRLRENVIGNRESIVFESFSPDFESGSLIEAPQYTRPEDFRGQKVPPVLLSGNHRLIREWQLQQAKERTRRRKNGAL
jgi:tRNA (guanine37-N1)-methyltransferase